mmetsp:Transcript_29383/g.53571  ORF Transcript_29383/g.53571 Transcript_29383/m.53571 type:complete len:586 (-) Transcript_29383:107-1864(-)
MVVGQLTALHCLAELPFTLPSEGFVTIGRRPENSVVCRDLAVSGTHCLVHCAPHGSAGSYEVEDTSTNGTYVNDNRLSRGQKLSLVHGDVISLTKPADDPPGTASSQLRVQFRLDVHQELARMQGSEATVVSPAQEPFAPTPPDLPRVPDRLSLGRLPSLSAQTAEVLAKDMLQQAQQNNARITSELLLVQRRLDEERAKVRQMDQDLRKAWAAQEDECARRVAVQVASDNLQQEVILLRADLERAKEWEQSSREAMVEVLAQQTELEVRMSEYRAAASAACKNKQQSEERLQAVALRCEKVCSIAGRVAEAVATSSTRSSTKPAEEPPQDPDRTTHEPAAITPPQSPQPIPVPTAEPATSKVEQEDRIGAPAKPVAEEVSAQDRQCASSSQDAGELSLVMHAPEVVDSVRPGGHADREASLHGGPLMAPGQTAPVSSIPCLELGAPPAEAKCAQTPQPPAPALAKAMSSGTTSGPVVISSTSALGGTPGTSRDSLVRQTEPGNSMLSLMAGGGEDSLIAAVAGGVMGGPGGAQQRNPPPHPPHALVSKDGVGQGLKRSGTASVLVLPGVQHGHATAKRIRLNAS